MTLMICQREKGWAALQVQVLRPTPKALKAINQVKKKKRSSQVLAKLLLLHSLQKLNQLVLIMKQWLKRWGLSHLAKKIHYSTSFYHSIRLFKATRCLQSSRQLPLKLKNIHQSLLRRKSQVPSKSSESRIAKWPEQCKMSLPHSNHNYLIRSL